MVKITEKKFPVEKSFIQGLKFLKENAVYVGIPDGHSNRRPDEEHNDFGITNADLLFIHTKGSPVNHIPARPVIEPALEDDKERIVKMLEEISKDAMEGNTPGALRRLKMLGLRAQNVCRGWFTNPKNNWAPNSPLVVLRKKRKGVTDPKPLIDTGELRKSITYFVDTKNGRIQ